MGQGPPAFPIPPAGPIIRPPPARVPSGRGLSAGQPWPYRQVPPFVDRITRAAGLAGS